MKTITILTDYKNNFGSKYNALPYNSGMDKTLLKKYFANNHFETVFVPFADILNYENSYWKNKIVIYTSSEDTGYFYKSYIEDIILYLELSGANVIPPFKYLRANNNKVFMELLRYSLGNELLNGNSAKVYGCKEELQSRCAIFSYPVVYKQAAGAMSEGVGMARNHTELIKNAKKIARTRNIFREFWELGRSIKYPGYIAQSKFRNKFIIQHFINGLNGDFKVLVFGDKFYVLKREAKKGDFRASGSGIRNFIKEIPNELLEYANKCFLLLDIPNVSLDIAFDGNSFHLIEFQCLYFGSFTLTYSPFFWSRTDCGTFILTEGESILEEEYARSISKFCKKE